MPEFILDKGSAGAEFAKLDSFVQGYIECAFFCDSGTSDDGDMESATFSDMPRDVVQQAINDCTRFRQENAAALAKYYEHYDEGRAGNDFWYSRNGHGTGFFDRDKADTADELQEACRKWRETGLYRGDDGKVYFE